MTTLTMNRLTMNRLPTNRLPTNMLPINRQTINTAGNMLAAERIKLLANRSLWWCSGVAVLSASGLVAAIALGSPENAVRGDEGVGIALLAVMVMAVLAVTGEYRHRTIRATFLAMPNRGTALLAKTAVVVCAASAIALVAGLGGQVAVAVLRPEQGWSLSALLDWRSALVFPLYAATAVTAAILVRHTAGAIVLAVLWPVAQALVPLIPGVDHRLAHWLPFTAIDQFWSATEHDPNRRMFVDQMPMGPWGSLAYSAVIVGLGLALALYLANRRDA
jgi:ABC-2 type transport system permease protein